MNITSLLITFSGIIFIFALYLISRIAQSKLPKDHAIMIPDLKDADGNRFTSILDDIPATDGSTPTPIMERVINETTHDSDNLQAGNESQDKTKQQSIQGSGQDSTQHILFISAKDGGSLDGNIILAALKNHQLVFGDMDIYHYFVDAVDEENNKTGARTSLFRVANGMQPWTLKQQDLKNQTLLGLSVVLLTPTKMNDKEAIKIFINITKNLANEINGTVKNQQQQILTDEDESKLIQSIK